MAEEKKQEPTGIAHLLARKNILELSPYRCARDDYSTGVLLDANENAFGPTSLPDNALDPWDNHSVLERYPDPYQVPLKQLFAEYRGHGLKPENIFAGVGSDEAIDLLMRIFCRPGQDKILTTPPTYGMYKVCAKVNDVEIIQVPLDKEFNLRIPEVSSFNQTEMNLPEADGLFLCIFSDQPFPLNNTHFSSQHCQFCDRNPTYGPTIHRCWLQ